MSRTLKARIERLEAARAAVVAAGRPAYLAFPDVQDAADLPDLGGYRGKVYIGFDGPDAWDAEGAGNGA